MTLAQIKEQIELAGSKLAEPVEGWMSVVPPVIMEIDSEHEQQLVIGVAAGSCTPVKYLHNGVRHYGSEFCRALPVKKKWLMTPEEIADGWICQPFGWRVRVNAVCGGPLGGVEFLINTDTGIFVHLHSIQYLHEKGYKFARTATSEPVSLEVEDDK